MATSRPAQPSQKLGESQLVVHEGVAMGPPDLQVSAKMSAFMWVM